MEINRINNDLFNYYNSNKASVIPKGDEKRSGDSFEISETAKVLQKSGMETKDLEIIRKKISERYYNNDEVIQETAKRFLESLQQSGKKG